jgi:hypothetical protein
MIAETAWQRQRLQRLLRISTSAISNPLPLGVQAVRCRYLRALGVSGRTGLHRIRCVVSQCHKGYEQESSITKLHSNSLDSGRNVCKRNPAPITIVACSKTFSDVGWHCNARRRPRRRCWKITDRVPNWQTILPTIRDSLEVAAQVVHDYRVAAMMPLLESAQALLHTADLSIAVVGRFKAGKSSFLNDLFGFQLLPIGVLPVTSVITEVTFGPAEDVLIEFLDGHSEHRSTADISQFVSEVECSVRVIQNSHVTLPRIETDEYLISVGAQPEFSSSLDRGLQLATTDMVEWLVKQYQLEPWAAHQLIGTVGKYDVVTVAGSVALRVPKKYLPGK